MYFSHSRSEHKAGIWPQSPGWKHCSRQGKKHVFTWPSPWWNVPDRKTVQDILRGHQRMSIVNFFQCGISIITIYTANSD